VSHSTGQWHLTLKWQRQSGLVTFISMPCSSLMHLSL